MKKLKSVLSFVFTLGIMCLGFSFVSFNGKTDTAFAYSSQIVLEENAVFNMAGGTISNSVGNNGGAIYVGEGATFTMTGGKIKNCSATNGGAVYVANGGTFNFDGGTIENCVATNGGAVYVASGGTFNYENNADGFSGYGEGQDLHIYAEEGATVIAPGVNINIYVDNSSEPVKTIKKAGDTYIIDEEEMPLDYENCCGYFYDAKLSQCTNGVVDLTRVETASTINSKTTNAETLAINIYTRTADPNNFTFIENTTKGTYDIKAKNTSISGNIVLPKEYNNVQTSIAIGTTFSTGAFYNCTSMTGITFQDGLTEVADYAFANLTELKGELIIPDSVISIGDYAFNMCYNLTSLTLPNGLTTIGISAFYSCDGFTGELIIPDSVITIGNFAFNVCMGFTSLIIGEDVTSVGYSAFQNCTGLRSVYIPSNVTTMTADDLWMSPFFACSRSLVIYTGVANASSIPSGWGTYWNYINEAGAQLTVNYGYTLEQYKSAVGLTFAQSGAEERANDIEIEKNVYQCQIGIPEAILEKREYAIIPKSIKEKIA